MESFISAIILLFLVMDPFGNLPFFIASCKNASPERYLKIVIRESLVALAVILLFLFAGDQILKILKISTSSIELAGGIVLFLIAIKLIFGSPTTQLDKDSHGKNQEPFIVPLAIPYIAGPGAISTVILIGGKSSGAADVLSAAAGVSVAWIGGTLILLAGRRIAKMLGNKTLDASESLMGLLLTAIAVEMFVSGIKSAFLSGIH